MRFSNPNLQEYVRFLICGAANTGLTYGLYIIFLRLLPYGWSYSLAYVLGIGISYLLNSHLVFRQPVALAKFLQYPVVYLVQYGLGIIILYICIGLFGMNKLLAPAVVIVISLPVTYGLSKLIIKGRA
ncbi:MAG: GtrA family protein [Firmicutes bacterium]|jgi:putative flippase GtrA|nr:GtrA family protein [Bacillota bacterium]